MRWNLSGSPPARGRRLDGTGEGLSEGLTSPLSRPDLDLAAQDLSDHGTALGGLFAE